MLMLTQTTLGLYTVRSSLAKQLFPIPFELSQQEYPVKLQLIPPTSSPHIEENFSLEVWTRFPDALLEPKNLLAVRVNEGADFLFLLSFWVKEDALVQNNNLAEFRHMLNISGNSNWFLVGLDFEINFFSSNIFSLKIRIFINKILVQEINATFQDDLHFDISKVFVTIGSHSIGDTLCSW
jgi:hypothetical protein